MKKSRAAFTLVELLVVITIMLIMATMVYAVFNGRNTDKTRSAARLAQSAFLGAKDRALHSKDLRGVRLIRDTTDQTLVTGFVYLQPLPMQTYALGSVALERHSSQNPLGPPADSADILMLHGYDAASPAPTPANFLTVDWAQKSQFFPTPFKVRIPSLTGQWYTAFVNTTGPYAIAKGNQYLQLQTPFVQQPGPGAFYFPAVQAWPVTSAYASCDIQLGNDLLPFHSPMSLPAGVVVDLKFCSSNVRALAGVGAPGTPPYVDLMFSPRGMLTGPVAAQGPLHFFLWDLADATATVNFVDAQGNTGTAGYFVGTPSLTSPVQGERMILTVFPQTGLVQAFDFDPTDADGNGLADNPFALAQQGKSAAR